MSWLMHHPNQQKALEEIEQTQSDRATAIVGAAFLEANVRRAIESRLQKDDDKRNQLFKNGGPLGNFEPKATLAYLMGLIGKNELLDLAHIAWVRNQFAHRMEPLQFGSRDIRERCDKIKIVDTHPFPAVPGKGLPDGQRSPSPLKENATARDRYILAIKLLTIVCFRSVHDYVIGPDGRAVKWVQVPEDGRAP